MLPGLGLGRIVHYVLCSSDIGASRKSCAGEIIPATVVNCWPSLNRDDGYANLYGFPDGSNNLDTFEKGNPIIWLTSRTYSESKEPGTFHWPPKV